MMMMMFISNKPKLAGGAIQCCSISVGRNPLLMITLH